MAINEAILTCTACGDSNSEARELDFWYLYKNLRLCPACVANYHGVSVHEWMRTFLERPVCYVLAAESGPLSERTPARPRKG